MNRQQMEAHLNLLGWVQGATQQGNFAMYHPDKASAVGVTASAIPFRINPLFVWPTDALLVSDKCFMALAERIQEVLA